LHNGLLSELRPTLRSLRRSPGFTTFAILTLAVGIGCTTAVFSVADAFLFKPFPFRQADRLLALEERAPGNATFASPVSPADFQEFVKRTTSYEEIAAWQQVDYNLADNGDPEAVFASEVTANFFDVLGIKPMLGRTFEPDQDRPDKNQVVVLSYGLWRSHFGGDRGIVGRNIKLNGSVFSVIGVMSRNLRFPAGTNLWTPLTFTPKAAANRRDRYLQLMGRLKNGITESQARAELQTVSALLAKTYPDTNEGWRATVQPLSHFIAGDLNRRFSVLLLGAVLFVLLIACATVINLQVARMSGREKEFAVRAALGASRWRIVRQIVAESTLLSVAAAVVSLLFSGWSLALILANMPAEVSRYIATWDDIQLDGRSLVFTGAIAILAGVLSGVVPSLRTGLKVNDTLKESARGMSAGRDKQRLRSILVIGEIAAAMVLLVGAGLMVKGSTSLIQVDRNVRPESILTMQIVLTDKHYALASQRAAFYDRVLERLTALPGVTAATVVSNVPYGVNETLASYELEGQPVRRASDRKTAQVQVISPNFLHTLGIPIIQGREFGESDGQNAPLVAIVSENFARRSWPGQNPIGHRLGLAGSPNAWLKVVGVVPDVRYDPWVTEVAPAVYRPYSQAPLYYTYLAVRTQGDPRLLAAPARRAIAALDIDRPLFEMVTLDRVIANQLIGLSYVSVMLTVLGAIALVFSAIGIYGLLAFSVTARTHEIGIRLALGAAKQDVLRMLAQRAVVLILVGLGVGLAISIPLARLLSSLIFGVAANDLATFAGTAILLAAVALVACYVPARRAMAVDPIVALRQE